MSSHELTIKLKAQIKLLENETDLISNDRKNDLELLAGDIKWQIEEYGFSKVIFVCTHNSRRSQLAQIWLRAACIYYGIQKVQSYSGGTEATAFNYRMVDALLRYGFELIKLNESTNPIYSAPYGEDQSDTMDMFSKKYDDAITPQANFIAVMVCSQADKDCPLVAGALSRMALPYDDPKDFDNTEKEIQAYDDKVREIGREVLYLTSIIKTEFIKEKISSKRL